MKYVNLCELVDCWKEYLSGLRKPFVSSIACPDASCFDFVLDALRRSGEVNKLCSFSELCEPLLNFRRSSFWLNCSLCKFPQFENFIHSGVCVFVLLDPKDKCHFEADFVLDWCFGQKDQRSLIIKDVVTYTLSKEIESSSSNFKVEEMFADKVVDPFLVRSNVYKHFLTGTSNCFETHEDQNILSILNKIFDFPCDKKMVIEFVFSCENIHKLIFMLKRKIYLLMKKCSDSEAKRFLNLICNIGKADFDSRMFPYLKNLNHNIALALIKFFDDDSSSC